MKEQDLRDNFNIEIVNYTTGLDNYSHTLDKCVQITLDYAREEAIGFSQWMHENAVYSGNGYYSVILGIGKVKNNQRLKQCYEIYLTTKTVIY